MSTKRRKRHNPEQIVRKLRDADAMLNVGKDLATVHNLPLSERELVNRYWDRDSPTNPLKPIDRNRLSRLRHKIRNDRRLRAFHDWQPGSN